MPAEILRRRSRKFHELFDYIRQSKTMAGSCDELAISLNGGLSGAPSVPVTVEGFSSLCKYLTGYVSRFC